jgi:hypothetical protein
MHDSWLSLHDATGEGSVHRLNELSDSVLQDAVIGAVNPLSVLAVYAHRKRSSWGKAQGLHTSDENVMSSGVHVCYCLWDRELC